MPDEAERATRTRRRSCSRPRAGTDDRSELDARARRREADATRAPRPALAGAKHASNHSPSGSVLRAIPCPEVTELICRLPLPTFFYWLEAIHLGDLLRISVRPGTKITPPRQDFQGSTTVHRTPREARCFTGSASISPAEPIPWTRQTLTKKRELFPGLPPTSPGSFALPHWTPRTGPISVTGFANINAIPFRAMFGHSIFNVSAGPRLSND